MLTIREIIDGMECMVRFTKHAEERMIERMIGYEDVIADCKAIGEELLSRKEGEEINVVNVAGSRISCIALNSDDDYNLFIDVKTVIDDGQIKKNRENIVINKKEEYENETNN